MKITLIAGLVIVNLVTSNSDSLSQQINSIDGESEELSRINNGTSAIETANSSLDTTSTPTAPSTSQTKSIAEWSIYAYRLEQNITALKEVHKCMTFVRIVVVDAENKYILCTSRTQLDPVYYEYHFEFFKKPEAYVNYILGMYDLAYDQQNYRLVRIHNQHPNATNWPPRNLNHLSKTEKWIFFLYAVKQCNKLLIRDPDLIFWKDLQTDFETKRRCNFICLAKVIALAKYDSDREAHEYSSLPEVDEVLASHKEEFRRCIWSYECETGFNFITTPFKRKVDRSIQSRCLLPVQLFSINNFLNF